MKDWIKTLFVGIILGVAGGLLTIEIVFRLSVDWTAVACFISITALIFTTYENRRRFKIDAQRTTKNYNADLLTELTSQFVANYQRVQKYQFQRHRNSAMMNYNGYFVEEDNKLINKVNDVILNIDSIYSQIEMLIIRIHADPNDNKLLSSMHESMTQLNTFNKSVEVTEISRNLKQTGSSDTVINRVNEMIEQQFDISKDKIKKIQTNSIELYQKLTS